MGASSRAARAQRGEGRGQGVVSVRGVLPSYGDDAPEEMHATQKCIARADILQSIPADNAATRVRVTALEALMLARRNPARYAILYSLANSAMWILVLRCKPYALLVQVKHCSTRVDLQTG